MKFIGRFLFSLFVAILLICIGLWISGNAHLIKAVRSTYLVGETGPTIDDYSKFKNRSVSTTTPQSWKQSRKYNKFKLKANLLSEINKWKPAAFVIIHHDSLLFEKYWNSYSESSLTNSFSMAKSFTSLAVGAAIKEGKIKSVDQKVGDFLPEFNYGEKAKITIENLLTMSSGLDFGESYGDPFGFMAKTYYGTDFYALTVNKPVKFKPNHVWHYQGGNTLLLSFILKKATGKNLSDYFAKKFWKPIGAEKEALWNISDDGKLERAYCCFYSNARDFARIGQLMLDSGSWKGNQLISKDYFKNSLTAVNINDKDEKLIDYYGYQWWFGDFNKEPFYYARGIQGQYIIWVPNWDAVIVRLGHKRDPTRGVKIPEDVFTYLEAAKKIIQN